MADLMPCGGQHIDIAPKKLSARPFTVFAGSLQRIDSSVVGFSRLSVGSLRMTQILGANPNRYGLQIDPDFGAAFTLLLSTTITPGGYASCWCPDNNSEHINAPPTQGAIVQSPWYATYESFALLQSDAIILTGIEWVED